jgi:hypothetical protein
MMEAAITSDYSAQKTQKTAIVKCVHMLLQDILIVPTLFTF